MLLITLPKDIVLYILSFTVAKKMKFQSWFAFKLQDINKLKFSDEEWVRRSLSKNRNAIDFLEENPELIDWQFISLNPRFAELYERIPSIFERNRYLWNWYSLSKNCQSIDFLQKHSSIIHNLKIKVVDCCDTVYRDDGTEKSLLRNLCATLDPKTIDTIRSHYIDKLTTEEWIILCKNPYAIGLIEEYWSKLPPPSSNIFNEITLCLIENPKALNIISNNIGKLTLSELQMLMKQEHAIQLIREKLYPRFGSYNKYLLANPAIFITDNIATNTYLEREYIKLESALIALL